MYELNISRLGVGAHIGGGKKGAVIECPKCQRPAVLIKRTKNSKAETFTYAHALRIESDKPEWGDVCVHSVPRD